MIARRLCPACSGKPSSSSAAVLSPWIRELAGITQRKTALHVCSNCGSAWFDPGYSEQEMSRIYSGYRGSEYLRIRSRWEPWYTSAWNRGLSEDHRVVSGRHTAVVSLVRQFVDPETLTSVVDIGGDQGQFIPLGRYRYVVDVSGRDVIHGIQRRRSLDEIESPDLIMSCHVLEHLSDPLAEMAKYKVAKFCYVEVPAGIPHLTWKRSAISQVGRLLARHPQAWGRVTSPATTRVASSISQPIRQSEHVNFFTDVGLVLLAQRSGLRALECKEAVGVSPDGYQGAVLQALVVPDS
jgi:hypothetical protein